MTSTDHLADNAPLVYHGIERPWRLEDFIRRTSEASGSRPYVIAIGEDRHPMAKEVIYSRVTSNAGVIDDTRNLDRWNKRQVLKGTSLKAKVLAAEVAAAGPGDTAEEREKLDKLAQQALELAGARDSAAIGTAVHALTDRYDHGLATPIIPDLYEHVLPEWRRVSRLVRRFSHIEQFMVHDGLRLAGTPDRLGVLWEPCPTCGAWLRVWELKTGRMDDFVWGRTGRQVATYAHSDLYDHRTGVRVPVPDLCRCLAWVVHLPAVGGEATVLEFELAAHWRAVQELTPQVRAERNRCRREKPLAVDVTAHGIRRAQTADELTAFWEAESAAGRWIPQVHGPLAQQRWGEIAVKTLPR